MRSWNPIITLCAGIQTDKMNKNWMGGTRQVQPTPLAYLLSPLFDRKQVSANKSSLESRQRAFFENFKRKRPSQKEEGSYAPTKSQDYLILVSALPADEVESNEATTKKRKTLPDTEQNAKLHYCSKESKEINK